MILLHEPLRLPDTIVRDIIEFFAHQYGFIIIFLLLVAEEIEHSHVYQVIVGDNKQILLVCLMTMVVYNRQNSVKFEKLIVKLWVAWMR